MWDLKYMFQQDIGSFVQSLISVYDFCKQHSNRDWHT